MLMVVAHIVCDYDCYIEVTHIWICVLIIHAKYCQTLFIIIDDTSRAVAPGLYIVVVAVHTVIVLLCILHMIVHVPVDGVHTCS